MSALDLIVAYLMAGYEDVTEGFKERIKPKVQAEAQELYDAVAVELAEKIWDQRRLPPLSAEDTAFNDMLSCVADLIEP